MTRATWVGGVVWGLMLTVNAAAVEPASPLRHAQQLRQAVSQALRSEATSTGTERDEAVRTLVRLHGELERDAALTAAERERLKGLIRSRLLRVEQRLQQQQTRQPQNVRLPAQLGDVLGQRLNQAGQAVGRGAAVEQAGDALLEMIKTTIRPETWEEVGGAGSIRLFPRWGSAAYPTFRELAAAAGGGAADDHGPELLSLIQTVIAPPSWDVNGGPGVIVYYRPLRVLVVRQTSEVHDQLGAVVGQLRP